MTVAEYASKFNELAEFAYDYIPSEAAHWRRFIDGLRRDIRAMVAASRLETYQPAYH
ncbi:hypothetical protein Scep_001449 [Stephania cephalantha]|uniref:Retrotransposon gag domain-containing protein n=1 Tax=Stephania cephalantha TaxID=152367 RepID=A0AAP0L806_9MAGN